MFVLVHVNCRHFSSSAQATQFYTRQGTSPSAKLPYPGHHKKSHSRHNASNGPLSPISCFMTTLSIGRSTSSTRALPNGIQRNR